MDRSALKTKKINPCIQLILLSPLTCATVANANEVKQLETIVVSAEKVEENADEHIHLSGFSAAQQQDIAASITVVTAQNLAEQQARVLSDVIKHDAALGDAYAPIGYYANVISRGFALDLASSYLINGNTVRGEQNIGLENKQQVEILKGISAIQSGMSTPGGVVNYVTKRPQDIQALTFAANQHGQFSVAADVGGFAGQNEQWGYRINVANEQLNSYVDHTDGERYFAALALDWQQPHSQSKFELDIEAQHASQRSVPGYQLLDGKVPEQVKWQRLLGYQTWGKPVGTDSLNASLKYNYAVSDTWNVGWIAAHSRSKVDDYSNFAWGCYYDTCQYSGLGNTFDQNGNYDIYDYQNPNDSFKTNQFKITLDGLLKTTWATHHLNIDLSQMDKTRDRFASVNKWIGVGNIHQDTVDFAPTTAQVGQSYQAIESQQFAVSALDQIEWNDQWSSFVGGKWINLNEQAQNKKRIKTRDTDLNQFLPQLALRYRPWASAMLYASYAKGLSDGHSAAWFAANDGETLAPIDSTQYEIGLKQQIKQFLFSASLFDLRQDNQYTKPTDTGFLFVQEGQQHSLGLELGLKGTLTEHLQLNSSLALTKARLEVDTADYRDHQMQNVPKVRFSTQLAYQVPTLDGLTLLAGGQYSASKYANKQASAKVDGYTVLDLGAAYAFKLNNTDAQLRFNLNNILNEKYWRDVGEFDGDDYMFLGAPRTANLSLQMNF